MIPLIKNNNINLRFLRVRNANIKEISNIDVPVWMRTPSTSTPTQVPVTVNIGKPIVDIPGCVTVHKENLKQRSKNKMLVDDDPKGNITLCDSGMPSYEPVDYQSQGLTWTTVVPKEPEPDGLDTDPPDPPKLPDTPNAPVIPPQSSEDMDCPGPKDLRVGDYSTSGDEKVSGHEWNDDKTICITLWEDVGFVEKYLPSPQIVTTTATIAVVATSSALLAKPLADLLLKIVKPLVKKVVGRVKKFFGKTDPVLSVSQRRLNQRERNRALLALRRTMKK
tara:strand:- start:350 stop:1183 length:834 start_codon:yes stop_codon:yes gene_type:complete